MNSNFEQSTPLTLKTILNYIGLGIALTCLVIPAPASANPNELAAVSRSGVTLTSESSAGASLAFKLPQLTQEKLSLQGEQFDRFSIGDEPVAGPEGWPELPTLVRYVLIPPDCGVELSIANVSSHTLANINPLPRQPFNESDDLDGTTASTPSSNNPLVRDNRLNEVTGFWPPEIAKVQRPAVMRGYRIVPIVINPVRYNPQSRELQVVDNFEIALNYNSSANRVNLVSDPAKHRTSTAIRSMLNQVVLNPMRDEPSRDAGRLGGSVVYVCGAGGQWDPVNEAIQPLVEWRRKMGYPTEILRVQDIGTAAAIKRELLTAYQEWEHPPEYIVLVGDGNYDFIVGWFDARNRAGSPYESDHGYACLDGDDLWPDAAVGRLAFSDADMLREIVTKVLNYEITPYIGEGDEVGWQKRAAFAATDSRSGRSTVDISQWAKQLVLDKGYTDVGECYYGDQQHVNPTNFLNGQFRAGISICGYRGWANMGGFTNPNVNELRNGRMLPFVMLITCNSNDFAETTWGDPYNYCDRFIHYTDGGAIGAVGSGGATHTQYNNLIYTGILHSIFNLGIHQQGWATYIGKSNLIAQYQDRGDIIHRENGGEAWLTSLLIFNLMGDPATDLYTDTPRRLAVSAPDVLNRGASHLEATVHYEDDGLPATDALVCLYKRDAFQLTAIPDENGRVSFAFDPEMAEDGEVSLTVTGHNLFPVLQSYNIAEAEAFIGARGIVTDDDNNGQSHGNADGVVNQLERLELTVHIANLGQTHPNGALDIQLTTDLPELTVVNGDARLNAAPQVGQSADARFVVGIEGGFPSGQTAVFNLSVTNGASVWQSAVSFNVVGADYELDSVVWQGEPIHRGANADLLIKIRNVGSTDGPPLNATLISNTELFAVISPNATFATINSGEVGESEGVFTVATHPFYFGGNIADMSLALESEDGFKDTVRLQLQNSLALANEPFGPDAYGYICYDDLDSGWMAVPEYNWVELNPFAGDVDHEGTNLELSDRDEEQDSTTLVDLPFEFQYYGRAFDQITVSTNGWLALGDCHELLLARNRTMPGPENAPNMLAPFWDDLLTVANQSAISTWYDAEGGRFYIEWSQMRKSGPEGNAEPNESFEVILHDPEFWPTFTGDGDIIFQYRDITDSYSSFQNYDTPFATVGICSQDRTTGLQYTYWHRPSAGADTLINGRAIKFSTLINNLQGVLRGRVYDAETRQPLEGVRLTVRYGFIAFTNAEGLFSIPDMLVDSLITLKASAPFYNDSLITHINVREGEETFIEIGLLHPEFVAGSDSIQLTMTSDSSTQRSFSIRNTGNGWLAYKSKFTFDEERDEADEPLELLRRWQLSDRLQDISIQSVVFVKDHWVVAGGANNDDQIDYFYILDREGNWIDRFDQPFFSRLGLRDMEYFDGYIWATNSDTAIYKIDSNFSHEEGANSLVGYYKTPRPLTTSKCITINPANGHLFVSGTTGLIFEYVVEENTLRQLQAIPLTDPRTGDNVEKSGFGWFADDPDGFPLYVISYHEFPADENQAGISLYKVNPVTGAIKFVSRFADVFPPTAGGRCGISITSRWNSQVTVLAAVIECARTDELAIFELAPNTSWLSYSPHADTLQSEEQAAIEFTIESTDLDTGAYLANLEISHNAAPGRFLLPIALKVSALPDVSAPLDDVIKLNSFELSQNYPNPFNQQTRIGFSIPAASKVRLSIWDVTGREVGVLVDREMEAGRHNLVWDAEGLSAGIYLCKLESSGKSATLKSLLIK